LFFDAWGKKLVSFNFKGTEYGIGWLPLGGYVKNLNLSHDVYRNTYYGFSIFIEFITFNHIA
jgi:membrane-associated protease RseP (regulator of RpoE activity)